MLESALTNLKAQQQKLHNLCLRASRSAWNTSLRDAFLRIFPLLLLMNATTAISLWISSGDLLEARTQLQAAASYLSQSMSFVFLLFALHSLSISYRLDKATLYTSGLLGYALLLVRDGEAVPLSIGGSLFIAACSTVLAIQAEKRHSPTRPSFFATYLRRPSITLAAIACALLIQLPLALLAESWMQQLNSSLQAATVSHQDSTPWVYTLYLLAVLARSTLGFMGFHGHNTLYDFFESLYASNDALRAIDLIFAAPGGNGATLCLILAAIYLHTKDRPIRQTEAQAIPFACMNINELLIYGLPVAWNPMLLMPFLLAPLLGASIGLMMGTAGYFDQAVQLNSWMTPVLLQPYFVSSDWIVLTLALCLSITGGTLLYISALRQNATLSDSFTFDTQAVQRATMWTAHSGNSIQDAMDIQSAQTVVARDLRADVIEFAYQPIIDRDGGVVAVEALLRLRHGDNFNGPMELLEACSLLELESELDRYVLNHAYKPIARLAEQLPELQLAINITPAFTRCDDFVAQVRQAIADCPLPLVLELTEGAPVEDMTSLCHEFSQLQAAGQVLIAIDDYGSGYSALTYLQSIRGDKLKLDQSLMAQLGNARGREVVRATVELGHCLGFSIVAEGVETREHLQHLRRMGVDNFQGYYFSKPLAFDELKSYLENAAPKSSDEWQWPMDKSA